MRGAFIRSLVRLAERDERICLLTGDLGFTVVEPFAERFPGRFINVGVAEQNMIGVATGLAEAGLLPFTYSIATFAVLRSYETLRNGPILHGLPVRVVGVGGGFEYGSAGITHHALEDLAVTRPLPGLTVIAPADHAQATTALEHTWDLPGPIYYRLGKDDVRTIDALAGRFELGRVEVVREGSDAAIVTTGAIALEAVLAADDLAREGIQTAVLIAATISPAPAVQLVEMLGRFRTVVTLEAHYAVGGLGSLVAEIVAGSSLDCQVIRLGVHGPGDGTSGSEAYLNRVHGLSAETVIECVHAALEHSVQR